MTVDTLSPDIFSSCLSAEAADAQKEPEVVLNDADLKVISHWSSSSIVRPAVIDQQSHSPIHVSVYTYS